MGAGAWFRLPDARRFSVLVAFGGLFFVGLGGLLTYSTYDLPRTSHEASILGGIAFVLLGAIPLAIGVRGIRAGVEISDGGVVVRNTLRTRRLELDDVIGFEAAPSPGSDAHIPAQALLRLRNGRTIRLSAFRDEGVASSGAARRRYDDVAAQVTAMNQRLATVRPPDEQR